MYTIVAVAMMHRNSYFSIFTIAMIVAESIVLIVLD
jgi:hypothetical protein